MASTALVLVLVLLAPHCGEGIGALRSFHEAESPVKVGAQGELDLGAQHVATLPQTAELAGTGVFRGNVGVPIPSPGAFHLSESLHSLAESVDIFTRPSHHRFASVGVSEVLASAPSADWLVLLGTVAVLMLVDFLVLRRLSSREATLPPDFEWRLKEIYKGCEGSAKGKVPKMDLLASCVRREDAELLFGSKCARTWGSLCSNLGAKFHSLTGDKDQTLTWEEFRCFYANELHNCGSSGHKPLTNLRTHGGILLFWLFVGAAFNGFIWFRRGSDAGCEWCTGYILEWILSMDNLFVFHIIFQTFATPRALLHKALFWGILGSAVFRILIFTTLASLLHVVHWIRFCFGAVLIYSGLLAASGVEQTSGEAVANTTAVRWLRRCLGSRLLERYDCVGQRLFVKESGRWRVTLLVLVIVLLELTDMLFALDSASAKVAQIPNYYLAYSSSVIAIFGLRAMFFVLQDLVECFELMNLGLCLILVFIGLELMASDYVRLDPQAVCVMILAVFVTCVAGSAAKRRTRGGDHTEAEGSVSSSLGE